YNPEDEQNRSAFRFHEGDLSGDWRNPEDIEVVKMFSWSTTRLPVSEIDDEHNIVHFTGQTSGPPRLFTWAGNRYYVDHVFEGLDSPGEWYLDRPSGTLYYMPRPGEDMRTAESVFPVVERLVDLRGDLESERPVRHITFRGLTFEHSTWSMPDTGLHERQAQVIIETAGIYARGAVGCTLEDCEVRHIGAHGVWLERGCRENRLERCHVWDIGAGGVYLGTTTHVPEASHNVVHNCFIHHLTEVHGGAIGVWIGRSSYNEVSRCDIGDTNYSGMSVGWSWGYAESTANHNIVADNHIHHCGHRALSDMGGIYTLGVSPGTELRHNRIHDIWCNPAYSHASGIYPDEGSSEILIENNIVYRCTSNGFLLHYGRELEVHNNIFAFAERDGVHRAREEDHISFFFERNIILSEHQDVLGGRWTNQNYEIDYNCYWCTTGEPVTFNGRSLEEWQEMGNDLHSIIAKPGFRAPQQGDFTLADDSPALQLGFEPIDQEGIGLYGDPEWVSLPQRFEHQPDDPLPPEPEPLQISEGFEAAPGLDEPAPLGGHPLHARVHTEDHPELVGITDEVAATGQRSLRVQDSPEMERDYNPHFYYTPHYREGVARSAFDIRISENTVMYHEWRDSSTPYQVGPSLWIRDGAIHVEGLEPLPIPVDEWVHIAVTAELGERADGTWDLAVTLPNGTEHSFHDIACPSPEWKALTWLGFVSSATEETVFYLDNIEVDRQG
ncbi:MAG: right-handed parallel beta-helix repeat-containing protein, partial [Armatimonadota bacterium]